MLLAINSNVCRVEKVVLRLDQIGGVVVVEVGADLALDGLEAVLVGGHICVAALGLDTLGRLQDLSIEGALQVPLLLLLELRAAVRVHPGDVSPQGSPVHELPVTLRAGK